MASFKHSKLCMKLSCLRYAMLPRGHVLEGLEGFPPCCPAQLTLSLQRRSRSSAVMHVTPELKVLGSHPGGGRTQCPRR